MGFAGLISNLEEAKEFAKHPVKPFDPYYSRDFDTWSAYFNDFKRFITAELTAIITELESDESLEDPTLSVSDTDLKSSKLEERRRISELYLMWYGTLQKLKRYDLASGQSLLPTNTGRYEAFTRF